MHFTYVGTVKDAFAQLITDFNKNEIRGLCSNNNIWAEEGLASWTPIFLTHVHDEAAMRVRSGLDMSHPEAASQGLIFRKL